MCDPVNPGIVNTLIERGYDALNAPRQPIPFTASEEANNILNNVDQYPHLFVLGCVADRQVSTERAWGMPYDIGQRANGYEFGDMVNVSLEDLGAWIRHPVRDMVGCLHGALLRIRDVYDGDARQMWSGNPVGASVVRRFIAFTGVRQKIGNMAANILLRDFKVPIRDKHTIDMPVDRNVMRVFRRMGFVCRDTHKEEICIYRAKELHPEYPAVFDYGVWRISQQWCRQRRPQCNQCDLSHICPRHEVE